jgi:putative ABC transport system ATP-binding protein
MTGSAKNHLIEAIDVHKTYSTGKVQLEALRGVNLKVERGEMLAIMGSSGCGKTTLLNCLSSLDEPSRGRVLIEGRDLFALSDNEQADLRAEKMGFIFQSYNLLPVLSALENVELPLMVGGISKSQAREKAFRALDRVGLKEWELHKPAELSGGQQQRVAIARSLVNDPIMVWADEPTGNLDSTNSKQIMKLLKKLNEDLNQTYIIVTHDSKVAKVADRIVKMENGKVI